MNAAPSVVAQLRHLEEELLRPEVRASRERVSALLAEDFVEFGSSGRVFTRNEIVDALRKERPAKRSLGGFQVTQLSDDVVLVTYRATRRGASGARAVRTLRSSIWRRHNGGWQLTFHQGTRAKSP